MGGFSGPMTREKMESLGHHTRGTYRGPLGWHYCMELYNDLQQAKHEDGTHVFRVGALRIVSQDEGYNIVYVLTEQEYQQPEKTKKEIIQSNKLKSRVRCLRCNLPATWDVNGYPYCETCGPERSQELLATEGIVSGFHCEMGFTWDLDGGLLIPKTRPWS